MRKKLNVLRRGQSCWSVAMATRFKQMHFKPVFYPDTKSDCSLIPLVHSKDISLTLCQSLKAWLHSQVSVELGICSTKPYQKDQKTAVSSPYCRKIVRKMNQSSRESKSKRKWSWIWPEMLQLKSRSSAKMMLSANKFGFLEKPDQGSTDQGSRIKDQGSRIIK